MSVSGPETIPKLEEEASMLRQQIAWANGERKFRLREKLAEVEAHIRFLQSNGDSDPAQISLF